MSREYRAEQAIHISGWECGTEIDLRMLVTFTVHPGCKQTLTDPGEEPSIEVDRVRFFAGLVEINLPQSIGDHFASSDGFEAWLMSEADDQRQAALEDAADHKREMSL